MNARRVPDVEGVGPRVEHGVDVAPGRQTPPPATPQGPPPEIHQEPPATPATPKDTQGGGPGPQGTAQDAPGGAQPAPPAVGATAEGTWMPPEPANVDAPTTRRIPAYLYASGVSTGRAYVKARATSSQRWAAWVDVVERMRADGITEQEIARFSAQLGAPIPPPAPQPPGQRPPAPPPAD